MEYSWIRIGGLWTQYAKLSGRNNSNALVIIPGNPGLPRFYEEFALEIAPHWPNHSIFILSNVGGVGNGPKQEKAFQDKRRYMLEGQIEHKLALIKKLVGESKVTLIGHSIGAYMALRLLDLMPCEKVIGITPTIERMEESPEGKRMTYAFSNLISLYSALFFIISLLPKSIRDLIVKLRGNYSGCVRACIRDEFLTSTAVWTTFFLAESEMVQVRSRPDDLLTRHSSKISLYYSQQDNWVPAHYYEELQKRHPTVKCRLLPPKIPHAFVEMYTTDTALFLRDNQY